MPSELGQQYTAQANGRLPRPAGQGTTQTQSQNLAKARESFSGRLLSDPQFDEAMAITKIIEREIYKSGAFKDKLKDYSFAMGRSENMDPRRVENIVRDLYKERTGQSLNKALEALKAREDHIPDNARDMALTAALEVELRMANGDKISFNRAVSEQAQMLADEFGVTDKHARRLMMEAFKDGQGEGGLEWRDWGKQLEEAYFRPQVEAEKQARAQARDEGDNQQRASGVRRSFRRR